MPRWLLLFMPRGAVYTLLARERARMRLP